jgi:glycosyltransferase involved in cell wall biosynthesis
VTPAPGAAPVTCYVFTLDEEMNLPHCLASLRPFDDVVVVDSYSRDRTPEIARRAGARFVQNEFRGFGEQRNWALEHAPPRHPWALILDADERVPAEMAAELARRLPSVSNQVAAFRVRRRFHLWGRWLRYSSLYPTWVVRLVRVGRVKFVSRGHAETQIVDGDTLPLQSDLIDENHKGLEAWWERQSRYAAQEAAALLTAPPPRWADLLAGDPLVRRAALNGLARRLPGTPVWYFLYSFFARGGLLDGADGLRFCLMKAAYQGMIRLKLHELRRAGASSVEGAP